MDEPARQQSSWSSRLARRLKISKSGRDEKPKEGNKLRKNGASADISLASAASAGRAGTHSQGNVNELGERRDYNYGLLGDISSHPADPTEMLHSLGATNFDAQAGDGMTPQDVNENNPVLMALQRRMLVLMTSLPEQVWLLIASHLELAERCSLAMVCKSSFDVLAPFNLSALTFPVNKQEKLRFLHFLDVHLPRHLLCFHCAIYHVRIQPGAESLMTNYVTNPPFICPAVRNTVLPRTRVAHGRELPYSFVQLTTRFARFGPSYGISAESLSRRWRDPATGWSHQTRYLINRGHLLLRVRSEGWARPGMTPSEARTLLFDREEYIPHFSVCKHWRDGELTQLCKCVLSHVPETPWSTLRKSKSNPALRKGPSPNVNTRQCSFCMPGRRCPECPSEYVVKIISAEDKNDANERFKSKLVVIRWCDLGDGSGPLASPEWAAINGLLDGYPSVELLKNRALMGTFESALTGVAPSNRVLNLNPKNVKKGEAGNDWY